MILPSRSQIYSNSINASINNAFLEDQLKPRDGGLGAIPDSGNILIALGVIIGLATICLIANFALIRWGHRSLFARTFCCMSSRRISASDLAISSLKTRKGKVLKKPKIYDVSLVSQNIFHKDTENLKWRSITPISVRYVKSSTKRPKDRYDTHSMTPLSAFPVIIPPSRTPAPSSAERVAIRVAVAVAMPHNPNSCNTPCYELGTTDVTAPWKIVERKRKELEKVNQNMKEGLDRRMAEAMLLRSVDRDYPTLPISVSYMTL